MLQVFEVNASSQRSGRQVLAQLQEATQSHQVSKKNLPDLMSVMSKMAAVPTPCKFLCLHSSRYFASRVFGFRSILVGGKFTAA